jgi:signal transduction histidine kinase
MYSYPVFWEEHAMAKLPLIRSLAAFALVLGLLTPILSAAADRGTAKEAKALVAKAVALYDREGREKAFAAFQDPKGGFVDRDLYVFVFGPKRTIVAHGGDSALVGTAAESLVDEDGVHFGTKFMDETTATGNWVDYKWRDPASGKVLAKSSWVVRHDGYIFGAGIYKPGKRK